MGRYADNPLFADDKSKTLTEQLKILQEGQNVDVKWLRIGCTGFDKKGESILTPYTTKVAMKKIKKC